ncbi:ligand-gated channel protein [Tistrella bauzanensis]|uniref:Ligand-gated channel protein n=1 Tax=Tistrella bauzanensis TaxID=657419 RepID=A0ABQ1ILX7_9PROT|nr:TonB-dependent hemoglobin/transferrin/lactoferrin family receptor [Tistrella bauzanensis]GGB46877.1 ligand-gated channel protein [Tistrella bauzanensis]
MTRSTAFAGRGWLPIAGATLATALFGMPAAAGETTTAATETVTRLDAVTITATRAEALVFDLPMSVSQIDRAALDDAQASDLTALRRLPNVDMGGGPRPAAQNPSIRGLYGPRVILSVDGARRNNEGGVLSPLLIDPDMIGGIDVVRGPVSAIYGSGGLGGVLAIRTLEADDLLAPGQTSGGRATLGWRSGNDAMSSGLAGATRGDDGDLLAALTYRRANDIRTGTGGDIDNDGDLLSGLFKGRADLGPDHRIEASYQRFSDDLTGPNNPGGNATFPFSQTLKRRQDQYSGRWSFADDDRSLIDGHLQLYYTKLRFSTSSEETPPLDPTSTVTETRGLSLQNTSRFTTGQALAHRLTYGVDHYVDTNTNRTAGTNNVVLPDGDLTATGLFIQDEVTLFDDWTLIGGLRHDRYEIEPDGLASSSHDRVSPKLALHWQPIPALGLFVGYGEAFRAPTLAEMYPNLSTTRALFNFIPNPDLKPETAHTTEAGMTLAFDDLAVAGDALRLKATVFSERVEDLIESQVAGTFTRDAPFSGTGLIFQRRNVAEAKRHGIEAEASYLAGPVDLSLGYSKLRSKNADTGAHLYAPPDKVTAGIGYAIDADWRLWYAGIYAAAQDDDDTLFRRRSGYALHDLGVVFDQSWYRVDLAVTNLFDTAYVTYQQSLAETYTYEEGRSVNLRLTARF